MRWRTGVAAAVALAARPAGGATCQPDVGWLFVRGLHHSGTTLLAKLLALHPEVATLVTGRYEDEGQHVQSVFPTVGRRSPSKCAGDIFTCPAFVKDQHQHKAPAAAWAQLCAEWTAYARPRGRAVVVEKTPDLLVPYLSWLTAKQAHPSRFAVIVRHPLGWHFDKDVALSSPVSGGGGRALVCRASPAPCVATWVGTWAGALSSLLATRPNQAWVLVRYEDLLLRFPGTFRDTLGRLGLDPAAFPFDQVVERGAARRRLEFHGTKGEPSAARGRGDGDAHQVELNGKYAWSSKVTRDDAACAGDPTALDPCCAHVRSVLAGPILRAFGYNVSHRRQSLVPWPARPQGGAFCSSQDPTACAAARGELAGLPHFPAVCARGGTGTGTGVSRKRRRRSKFHGQGVP